MEFEWSSRTQENTKGKLKRKYFMHVSLNYREKELFLYNV